MSDIGEGEDALLCFTNSSNCCSSVSGGEFYFPDNTAVRIKGSGDDFYRNRGNQSVSLNRRNNAMTPIGQYRCEIPDANGITQNMLITIIGKIIISWLPKLYQTVCIMLKYIGMYSSGI